MANVNLKTDFKDGEKLFGQQLNNNFAVIKAALEAMNKIVWQDDPDDSVTAFRGTTEEINQRDIIDGQLLYDTSTGETYIDVGSQRISTGSGNAIHIGSDTPTNPSTQIWIDPNEPLQLIGTEVVNSMEGNESNKAPSVRAVKEKVSAIDTRVNKLETYSTEEQVIGKWIDGKQLYRKVIDIGTVSKTELTTPVNISNLNKVTHVSGGGYMSNGNYIELNFKNQGGFASCYFQGIDNKLISYSDYELSDSFAIIEYTKTTDSEVISNEV